jgi:Zn-dependent M28 family amino/carboxypeptidase
MASAGHVLAQDANQQYGVLSRDTIERRLGILADKNADRARNLKQLFDEGGCQGKSAVEQPVKREKVPNIVCTMPGSSGSTIIIGAHFDHVDTGHGAVDNWTGAALLASLFQSLSVAPHKHTLIFIGFTGEEQGRAGSESYASQLSPDQTGRIRAMINLDSLGLGPTKIWSAHSDKALVDLLTAVSATMKLPVQNFDADLMGDEDSAPFRNLKIPTVMFHSVTQDTFPVLHSAKDTLEAVKLADYYDSYRLILAYLAYLDTKLD